MQTNLDKLFKTNGTLEQNGIWFDINDKTGFLVKPFKNTNPQMKAAMAALYKPHARQIEMDTLPPEKDLEIQVKLFVRACMVDWKGVEIDGKDTEYSPEIAVEFFISLPDLFSTLLSYSQDFKNYREDLGNS